LERQKLEKERKQREFQKKSNDYDYEDFEDDFVDIYGASGERRSGFWSPSSIFLILLSTLIFYLFFLKPKKNNSYDNKDD
jgi:hypothetical protein